MKDKDKKSVGNRLTKAAEPREKTQPKPQPAPQKTLSITDEKSLRILTDPLRQRLLAEMEILAEPVTAKRLADRLGIAPSSAKHHLLKLQGIGVVEVDHQATIHGIVATFYRRAAVNICVHAEQPAQQAQKQLMLQNELRLVEEGFWRKAQQMAENPTAPAWGTTDRSGVVHLTETELRELEQLVDAWLAAHQAPRPGTAPIRFALLCYNAGSEA